LLAQARAVEHRPAEKLDLTYEHELSLLAIENIPQSFAPRLMRSPSKSPPSSIPTTGRSSRRACFTMPPGSATISTAVPTRLLAPEVQLQLERYRAPLVEEPAHHHERAATGAASISAISWT